MSKDIFKKLLENSESQKYERAHSVADNLTDVEMYYTKSVIKSSNFYATVTGKIILIFFNFLVLYQLLSL
jgi:hypothetical protein